MVSVIIPCYNAENTLATTIDSVLKQKDQDWEIVAVNDGSTDSTLSLLNKLKRIDSRISVINQGNSGVSSARNIGIRHASGEWVYFLDSDDLIEDNLVGEINNLDKRIEMTVFDFIEKTVTHNRVHKIRDIDSLFHDYLVNRQTIHISSMAVKRNLISSNNIYFDENTYYGEDREFVAKLLALRPKMRHIGYQMFTYMFREGSAMTNSTYSERRFSSVLASERTYQNLIGTHEERNSRTNLGFTIARHLKMFYDYGCKDVDLENKLWQYADKYLKTQRGFGCNKVEIYTAFARVMACNRNLLKLFLKFY